MERIIRHYKSIYINDLKKSLEDWEIDYQEKEIRKYASKFRNINNYLQVGMAFLSIHARIKYKNITKVSIIPNLDNSDFLMCPIPDCTTKKNVIAFHCWIPSEYNMKNNINNNNGILIPLCDNHILKIGHEPKLLEDTVKNILIPKLLNLEVE